MKMFALILVWAMTLGLPLPGVAGDSVEFECISTATDAPTYHPPPDQTDIRRREAGESEGSGASRPMVRASRPMVRASRPMVRASRSLMRASRPMVRGAQRPMVRGEARPMVRGEATASIPKRMVPFAPAHTGLTSHPQPVLRWYISDPWPGDILFSLGEPKAESPLLETQLAGPDKAGVYQISLSDHQVTLTPGVEYEWYLAIVTDPNERSGDFLASATLTYVKPPEKLSTRLASTPDRQRYHVYAEEGYWYSAMEQISRQIDSTPDDKRLRSHRAALLKQVNLPIAAAYDCRNEQ